MIDWATLTMFIENINGSIFSMWALQKGPFGIWCFWSKLHCLILNEV